MTAKSDGSGKLIQAMLCDAKVLLYFEKIKESPMRIPDFEVSLSKLMLTSHVDKGVLLSRVTDADDFQRQINLTSVLQRHLDGIAELNFSIELFHRKWSEVYRHALKHLNTEYGDELNAYKDSTRTAIISAALYPVEQGVEYLNHCRKLGDKIQTHLVNTGWTIKEVTGIIREYFIQSRIITGLTNHTV